MPHIDDGLDIGVLLSHRVVHAPMTRCRCEMNIPTDVMKDYYSKRATRDGLIITESILISPNAGGFSNVPGLWTDIQIHSWQQITKAIHDKGGFVFGQLWHAGRASSVLPSGQTLLSSCEEPLQGTCKWTDKPFGTPKIALHHDMDGVASDYKAAAINALQAGFDGVELQFAYAQLPDQFLQDNINKQTKTIQERILFPLRIVDAVCGAISSRKCAVRLSPFSTSEGAADSDPITHFEYVCTQLEKRMLAYVHLVEGRASRQQAGGSCLRPMPPSTLLPFRKVLHRTPLLGAGSYSPEKAQAYIVDGLIDAAAFGKASTSNPDLADRVLHNHPLRAWDPETFVSGGTKGYTDLLADET